MIVRLLFFVLFSFSVGFSFAQSTAGVLSQAEKKLNEYAYVEAIELYEFLLDKGDSSARVIRHLAEAYRLTNNYNKAEYWYSYIVGKKKCNSNDVYKYVLLLRSNEKYKAADSVLNLFDAKFKRDSRVKRYKQQPNYVDSLQSKSKEYVVKKLTINSEAEDHSPAFYDDQIVFVSSRKKGSMVKRRYVWTNEPFLDYYGFKVPKNNSTEEKVEVYPIFKELNSVLHEGQITFSKNGGEAYFTSNNLERSYSNRSSTGVAHLMIYKAEYMDGKWQNIKPMRFNVQEFSYAYPSLSEDGKTLYFCSNRSGGNGGADIYKVERANYTSDWSGPIHLGDEINTEGNEVFPYIHPNGELYFSSDGHPGLGGLDIFRATSDGNEVLIENLGNSINGSKDDFGFILDKKERSGYFSSNREGGEGKDDLYGFTFSKEHFEKLNYVKLDAIVDSLYTLSLNDPALLDDPELVEKLRELGFVKGSFISIRASDISDLDDLELREKLRKLGLFDSETLAMMLDEDVLLEQEQKRKRLKKLAMIQDSIYTMDLSESDLLDDPELVAKLTEMGYLKGNILTIKASEISKIEDKGIREKLNNAGLLSKEQLVEKQFEEQLALQKNAEPPRKKLQKLDMIKDSLYTIELNEDDFIDDPSLYAELEEMGYIKDNILKIKSSELKKLDRNIKERLAKIGIFDRKTLGLGGLSPAPVAQKEVEEITKDEMQQTVSEKLVAQHEEKPEEDVGMPMDYFVFQGSIQEHNSSNKLKDVKILIRDKHREGTQFAGKTDEFGVFRDTVRGCKPHTTVSLYITLKKKGYISKSFSFEEQLGDYGVINLEDFLKKIQMTKFDINVEIGSAANLNPIYFEYNSADLTTTAKVELDKLAEILIEEPRLLIELGSHTDSKGNDEYNLNLSEERANSTKAYVVSKGVEAFRIKAVGYGETKLKNHCANNVSCSDEEHAINRRTEFRVIGLN